MSSFKKIAIAGGTGQVGKHLVTAFLESKQFEVSVLSRPSTNPLKTEYQEKGAKIVEVEFSNVISLKEALTGIDAVISALPGHELDQSQTLLALASKLAGVSRFIPSEFGVDVDDKKNPFFEQKQRAREIISGLGLDYTYYITGFFLDHLVSPAYGFHIDNSKVDFIGDGHTQFTTTSLKDIAHFVVKTINLPESRNAKLYVNGEVTSFYKISQQVQALIGKEFRREYITVERAQEVRADPQTEFLTNLFYGLRLEIELGGALSIYDHTTLVDGFRPSSVIDFIRKTHTSV